MLLIAIFAAGALVAGACGGGAKEAAPAPPTGGTVAAPTPTPTKAPPPEEKKGGGTLVVASTLSDIPDTGGQTTQGHEGFRFVGFNISDGLTRWDLTKGEVNSDIVPGLATSWKIDPTDQKKWIFQLRRGVKFHDGTDYNADAAVYIFDRIKKSVSRGEAAHFNKNQAANVSAFAASLADWRKIDDYTIEVTTTVANSFLPYQSSFYLSVSPTRYKELGADGYFKNPAGTGPWKFEKLVPREKLELVPNKEYWGMAPRADRMIILPMPDPSSRLAALRTGLVNWVEVPPADAIPGLKKDGFQIFLNKTPHTWNYSYLHNRAPFNKKNLRIALNYDIEREGMCKDLLNGTCIPAISMMYPGHPWYGDPPRKYNYNPQKACELVKGEGLDRVKFTINAPTGGSGMMLTVPMNEYIQRMAKAACFDIEFILVDWSALGAYHATHNWDAYDARNSSTASQDPYSAFTRNYHTRSFPPVAGNSGFYSNPDFDRAIEKAETAFDINERDKYLRQANEILNEDAAWVYVVHDLNPRVLAPNVRDFVQPQSWFTDNQLPWVKQ
jgi:peptide/nickel transport system substrate-binding protein